MVATNTSRCSSNVSKVCLQGRGCRQASEMKVTVPPSRVMSKPSLTWLPRRLAGCGAPLRCAAQGSIRLPRAVVSAQAFTEQIAELPAGARTTA